MTEPLQLHRWINAGDVVPGLVVRNPYGGMILEIEERREEHGKILFSGWATDPATGDGKRFADAPHRHNSPLWLVGDMRSLIAY